MITENEYLKAKEVVEKYEKQQLEMKELLSKESLIIRKTKKLENLKWFIQDAGGNLLKDVQNAKNLIWLEYQSIIYYC